MGSITESHSGGKTGLVVCELGALPMGSLWCYVKRHVRFFRKEKAIKVVVSVILIREGEG